VRRVGIGVSILSDQYAARWGIEGVIVREPSRGGAAEKAGIRAMEIDQRGNVMAFDVIKAIDGLPVRNFDDLYSALDGREPGEAVAIEFHRGKKRKNVKIRLVELP
jgi:S1-C subfamily serine protease